MKGKWTYLYRAVDKQSKTIDFLLSEKRDKAAAKRFFIKAIGNNGEPEKITLDGYEASHQAVFELKAEGEGRSTGPAGLGGGARSMKYYLWTISVLAAPFTEFAPEPQFVALT